MPQIKQAAPTRAHIRAQRVLLEKLEKAKARIAELEKENAALKTKVAAIPATPAPTPVPETTQVIPPAQQADLANQSKTA